MSSQCCYCINKSKCSECDKTWKDMFIPSEEVRHYFDICYVGGKQETVYSWNSTNEFLIPTHSITIGNRYYCPYCGEKMFPIQHAIHRGNYDVTGWCCICQGARDEIEYEAKREELAQKHAKEFNELDKEYHEKLKFCSETLINMQIKEIKEHCVLHEYNHSYISSINGEKYHSVKQLMDL